MCGDVVRRRMSKDELVELIVSEKSRELAAPTTATQAPRHREQSRHLRRKNCSLFVKITRLRPSKNSPAALYRVPTPVYFVPAPEIFSSTTTMLRQFARATARFPARQAVVAIRGNASASPAAAVDPKISQIVDQIATLTLLETSSLVTELKTRLNISDIALPAAGAAPAAAPAAAEEEVKEVVEEQTIFAIKLESFEPKSKPKIIKEVKGLLGLSLVESKKFVESAPKVLKDNVAKEDADKIKALLEGLGAKVTLE